MSMNIDMTKFDNEIIEDEDFNRLSIVALNSRLMIKTKIDDFEEFHLSNQFFICFRYS